MTGQEGQGNMRLRQEDRGTDDRGRRARVGLGWAGWPRGRGQGQESQL
jgi:hypothetical protein